MSMLKQSCYIPFRHVYSELYCNLEVFQVIQWCLQKPMKVLPKCKAIREKCTVKLDFKLASKKPDLQVVLLISADEKVAKNMCVLISTGILPLNLELYLPNNYK